MSFDTAEIKRRQRAMWSAGDYPDIATRIQSVADATVEAVDVQDGDTLLDVATGTGNAALVAAQRGARVTGLDLTPELLEVARARAAEAGVEIHFLEGDAEQLPFGDGSFDRVTSVFGAMFAPDQPRAAAELLRVVRPGGTVAVAAWTPEGLNGSMFGVLGRHLPPPPEGFRPPILWGSEQVVRELFADAEQVTSERRNAVDSVRAPSVDAWIDYMEQVLGPTVMAKAALAPDGRWAAARADLVALYEQHNEATDGSILAHPEYLLTVVRKAA
jgi:ubiquinone/menaquinone biosynthesis C-methylase UbiE